MNIASETGWSERDILNMSYARSWAYQHDILRKRGKETYFRFGEADMDDMFNLFDSLAN
jgi:hypothetical protein